MPGEKRPKVIKYKPKVPPKEGAENADAQEEEEEEVNDSDLDIDSDELPEEYYAYTDLQKKEWRDRRERIKQERKDNFIKRDEYHKELREKTLKTFEDRPDQVKSLRCGLVRAREFVVEWDAP